MSQSFGKFRLMQQIGGSRLSQVFRVTRRASTKPHIHESIVLKRVHPSMIGDATFVRLVVREAGLLTTLSHPGLCSAYELGMVDGCAFFTMSQVHGCTLRAIMRRLSALEVRLPVSAVIDIGQQLAGVLDYLHRQSPTPLAHLDLSPQNVMISREGEVKLIDFGIAAFLDGHDPPPLEGKIAGTIGYMSPEQARGELVNQRADQFGMGILLWELLTAQRLFKGSNSETWRKMRNGEIDESVLKPDEKHPELSTIVERLLHPEHASRFAHLGETAQALAGLAASSSNSRQIISTLVQHLLAIDDFDPFDVVSSSTAAASALQEHDIPDGKISSNADYEDMQIEIDQSTDSPASLIRRAVPSGELLPVSPFLEALEDFPERSGQVSSEVEEKKFEGKEREISDLLIRSS